MPPPWSAALVWRGVRSRLDSASVCAVSGVALQDRLILAAARGDHEAFGRSVEPHISGLRGHCYRLLGCAYDADDAVQEGLLRAWRGFDGFDHRRPLRPWLYKIVTNVCLDMLGSRSQRFLPFDLTAADSADEASLPASMLITPYPDHRLSSALAWTSPAARYEQREALELAFIAALQHLPARQRAILVLRDVLGFTVAEIAGNLETSVASVNSALQRARRHLGDLLPDPSHHDAIGSIGDSQARRIAQRFADAMEEGDVRAVIDLLDSDASFAMPPYARWCRGREAVAASWLMPPREPGLLRFIPIGANGQLAFAVYRRRSGHDSYLPLALDVISIKSARIASVIAFRDSELFGLFELPASLPAAA